MQTVTNITLAAGSTAATIADATRLVRGMTVIATGISAGTTIAAISGTTLALSPAGSTGTVQGRFSFIGDAQNPGQVGGDTITGLGVDQIPPITPSGTLDPVPDHAHSFSYNQQNAYGAAGGGTVITVGQTPANSTTQTSLSGGHTPVFHRTTFGGGQAHPNLQPTRLGTFYMKV